METVSTEGIKPVVMAMLSKIKPISHEDAQRHRYETSIAPRMISIGFPPRYAKSVDIIPCVPQQRCIDYCRESFKYTGSIVALVGERGVGKTFIASQLFKERVEAWISYYEKMPEDRPKTPPMRLGKYIKLVDVISMFKPLYADFGSIETDALMDRRESLCGESLLIIDELHECHDQRMKGRVLTDVIDRRYSNQLDTLLISNETVAAFKESVGDSVLSRLGEHGKIVECKWKSFRETL